MTEEVVYNQSSMLTRMISNGNNEVSYLNAFNDSFNQKYIYEGSGRLKFIQEGFVKYATNWSIVSGNGMSDAKRKTSSRKYSKRKFVRDAVTVVDLFFAITYC